MSERTPLIPPAFPSGAAVVYPDFIFGYDEGVKFLKSGGWTDEEIAAIGDDGVAVKRPGGGSITLGPNPRRAR